MNKKQTYVFLLYIIVEIYVFFLPLPSPSNGSVGQVSFSPAHAWNRNLGKESSLTDENESPERIDIASWVSIFFFLLFIAATFYRSEKNLNLKEK